MTERSNFDIKTFKYWNYLFIFITDVGWTSKKILKVVVPVCNPVFLCLPFQLTLSRSFPASKVIYQPPAIRPCLELACTVSTSLILLFRSSSMTRLIVVYVFKTALRFLVLNSIILGSVLLIYYIGILDFICSLCDSWITGRKGRNMGNIRTIFNLIDYCDLNDIPCCIVLIDIEKAFDSFEHDYLFQVL